jgi:hypothetical protein
MKKSSTAAAKGVGNGRRGCRIEGLSSYNLAHSGLHYLMRKQRKRPKLCMNEFVNSNKVGCQCQYQYIFWLRFHATEGDGIKFNHEEVSLAIIQLANTPR